MGKIKAPHDHAGARISTPASRTPDTKISEHPVFCFRHISSKFSLRDCSKEEIKRFVDGLVMRSQLSWSQLHDEPREKLGSEFIPVAQLTDNAPSHFRESEKAMVFRFGGARHRFAGFRIGAIFHVVWVDPKLKLYKH